MFCLWQGDDFSFNSWCLNSERRKLDHNVEQNRELIKSPTINSVAVGNPSTPRNQPSHRNVLQRKKQATSVRNRLPPSAPTPTRSSRARGAVLKCTESWGEEGGTEKSKINTKDEPKAGPALGTIFRLKVSFLTQRYWGLAEPILPGGVSGVPFSQSTWNTEAEG